MKKSSLYGLLIAGCFLVVVVLALAIIAFWMEKKAGHVPVVTPPAAASARVPAGRAPGAAAVASTVAQEASQSAQSPQEEQRHVEYDGVVHGPMTM